MTGLLQGENLLFLHGAGGRGLIWQQQLLAFPRSVAPDLPWHPGPLRASGQSTPGTWGAARWGVNRYLAAVRAYLGPASAPRIIAGHSLGGAIALLWGLTVPREVRGLILMGTGARLRVSPVVLATLRAHYNRGLEQLIALWFSPLATPRLKEKSQILLRAVPPEVLIAELQAARAFDVSADVGRLNVPVLVMCGSDDQVTPPAASRQLHEKIPGSHLVIVEGAGHMVMLEEPHATNDAIRAFLQALDRNG